MKQITFKSRFLVLLVGLLTMCVTQVWGADEPLFTITSASVVTNSGYQKYSTTVDEREWLITFGGNNKSIGTNSANRSKCTLSSYSKYAVSPATSSSIASAFVSTSSIDDITKVSYTFNGGSNQTNTNVYLIYSSDGTTFSQLTLTNGTQGHSISSGTTLEFNKCSGYFGLLFVATNSSEAWRIDDVNISFYGGSKTLDKIELSGQNTEFTQNDTWSFGGTVTATYTDKTIADVTSKATFSGYNTANTGSQTVTASYTEGGVTKTATYSINVAAPKTLTSISVTTAPKTNYTTCETLVVSDWVVTGTYSDASTADVTSACTFSKANGASLLTTDTKVTVTHTATSKTCEKAITVSQGARDTFVDHIQGNADQYGDCEGYTVPTLTDGDKTSGDECQNAHYKFIGWSSTTISTGVQTEPASLLKAGDTHDATGATYYAVWAKEED